MKKMRLFLIFIVLNPIYGLIAGTPTWQPMGLDEANQGSVGPIWYSNIVIDNSGIPYIVYQDSLRGRKITVKKFISNSWVTVGNAGFSPGQANFTSIALDGNGTPYVAFSDYSNSIKATVMKYEGPGGNWVLVGSAGFSAGQVENITIAFGTNNTPYVGYCDYAYNYKATLKKFDGSNWVNVGNPGFTSDKTIFTAIAIDHNGTPYIAYDANNYPIIGASVMKFDGANWVNVGSGRISTGAASWVSIAIDANNTPYVGYWDGGNSGKATVQKFDGSSWSLVGNAPASPGGGESTAIAIDPNGIPYIIYLDDLNNMKSTVAKFNGSGWVTVGSADFSLGKSYFNYIAIDNNGTPYVCSEDFGNNRKATVRKFDGSNWVMVGNNSFGVAYGNTRYSSMTIDSRGTPYMAYQDSGKIARVSVNKFDGTNWVPLGSGGFSAGAATYTDIAVDGNFTPYVVYSDAGNSNKATVMKFNGSFWVTVGSAGFSTGTVVYTSIAIDAGGTPYVVYVDGATGPATVKKFDGSAWVTVGSAGFTSSSVIYTTIAIDGNGIPYVGFADATNSNKATVMKFNGSSWVNVGSALFSVGAATYASIAIDHNNTPFIVYKDGANSNKATVMKFNGSSWGAVGSAGISAGAANYTSIAVDGSNLPYIVYSDSINGYRATVMKYNGSNWSVLGSAGFTAWQNTYTSIAVDAYANVFVTGTDYGAWGYKYQFPCINPGTISPLTYCAGTTVNVPYTVACSINSDNVFTVQLSDATGSFANPIDIGSLASASSGTISAIIPSNTAAGSAYRIRVISSGPAVVSPDNGTNITVNALSADPASATASSPSICIGSNTVLTLNGGGGGTGEVVKWYTGNCAGTLAGTGNNLTVSPVATTTYYGRYEDATCNYNSACQSVTVTVNSKPVVGYIVSPSSSVCYGTAVTLNGTEAGSYHWSGGVTDGEAFVPALTATFTVTGTDANGCSNTGSFTLTVKQASSSSMTVTMCDSYTWKGTTYTASGTYIYHTTNAAGCDSAVTLYLTINANPAAAAGSNSPVCVNNTLNLSSGGGTGYSWHGPNSFSSALQNPFVSNAPTAASGTYTVTVTGDNGCTATATTSAIVNMCTATLNVKIFLQGYYQNTGSTTPMDNFGNGGCLYITGKSTNRNDVDTVKVTLVDSLLHPVVVEKAILKTGGALSLSYPLNGTVVTGRRYYLQVTHRNSIETWSASPVILGDTTNFDFTTSAGKAYGSNMVEVEPGKWAIYSGDIADASLGAGYQDGVVETSDYSEMENSAYRVLTGYVVQDITGDGVVETSDYALMENNAYLVVHSMHP